MKDDSMISLTQLINELNVPKSEDAYELSGPNVGNFYGAPNFGKQTYYTWNYTNVKDQKMEITINIEENTERSEKNKDDDRPMVYIAFSQAKPQSDNDDEEKYQETTGAGDFIKVLATVVEAFNRTAKMHFKKDGVRAIKNLSISPSDERRKNIYDHYIKTLFPDFEKDRWRSYSSFLVYTNKNYKGE